MRLFTGNLITAGFDYQRFGGKAWNHFLNTDTDQPLVDKTIDDLAGYIDFRQDIGKTITLDAGVRFDHNSHTGNEWIPQGGLTLYLPRRTELKAVVSKGFRNPTIREMYMFPPQNPNLQPEKVINYEIAFSQKFPQQGVSYGVNVFYLHGNNLIQTMRVSNGMLNVNTGEIDNFGIEAEINWQITDSWKISAQYSWLHMERPILASPEHKVSTTVYYSKERWTASTDLQYVHGLYTSLDSHAREKFLLWNARVNYRIYRFLRIFAKGENLLAQRYEINQGFPMPKATCMGGIDIQF
jgi:iron complex outermembrane receptor protein